MRSVDDRLTLLLRRATDAIFMENYLGTSVGVLIGIILDGVAEITKELLPATAPVLTTLGLWFWIPVGIAPFALATYRRRMRLPRAIDMALAEIRYARRRGDITDVQAQLLASHLLTKLTERTALRIVTLDDAALQQEMDRLEKAVLYATDLGRRDSSG